MIRLKEINPILLDKFFSNTPKTIALAVSGGADSMCMALITKMWSEFKKVKIICLTVNHNLRDESTEEAKWVQQYLHTQGLDCQILHWGGEKPQSNIHHQARNIRYKLLTDYCHEHGIEHLMVAHNFEDQAETMLLRIKRGSGIEGLKGMLDRTKSNGVTLIRPLLTTSRTDIIQTMEENEWEWIEDPSNKNDRFERVKIRNLLNSLPDKDTWIKRLNLLAQNMQRANRYISAEVNRTYNETVFEGEINYAAIDVIKFMALGEEVALRLLVKVFNHISGKYYTPRLNSLVSLYKHIIQADFKALTLHNVEINNTGNKLVIFPEIISLPCFKLEAGKEYSWHTGYKVATTIPDLMVKPLGVKGWQEIHTDLTIIPDAPFKKILYTTPALFDKNDKVVGSMFIPNKNHSITRAIK